MSLRSRSDDDEKEKLLLLKGKPLRHIEGSCELLDESEQDKIIDDLKQEAYSQSQWNREVFHYLYLAVSMLYVVCMYYTYQIPYSMGHQRIFEDVVQIRSFYVFYTGSVYCSIVAAFIVKVRMMLCPYLVHLSWLTSFYHVALLFLPWSDAQLDRTADSPVVAGVLVEHHVEASCACAEYPVAATGQPLHPSLVGLHRQGYQRVGVVCRAHGCIQIQPQVRIV